MDNENPELENPIEVNIDTEGMENRIVEKMNVKFLAIEEMLTAQEKTKALTESLTGDKFVDYNWKDGISENLHSFKKSDNIGTDVWQNRRPMAEVAVRTYNEEKKLHEYKLSEKLVEAIGTLSTTNCCIPEVWADKIERDHVYPGSVFLGADFVKWYDDIEGKPGDKINICRVAPVICTDLTCEEPDTTAPVVVCPAIELEHDVCATAICKNTMETVQYGLVDAITEGLGSCLQVCVDNYFFHTAMSCTNAGTLVCTGPMAGSILIESMGSMMAGTYLPVKVIMHPVVWASLMQDSNFSYANRFGSRDPIYGGRLEQAYGLDINVTPKGTLILPTWDWGAVSGTYRTLLLAKGALAGALKHGITVETEYSPRLQKKWIIADIKYGGVCLHPDGIFWIHTVESPFSC